MPLAPLRSCAEPGCPTLVRAGRCVVHQQAHARQQWQDRPSYHALYNTRRWKRASRDFLIRYPFCGDRPNGLPAVMSRCREQGIQRTADQTDHIEPHHGDLVLFWSETNWQALCRYCGASKSKAGL
jgi:5-methylcytosine-specific restriction enzyme A